MTSNPKPPYIRSTAFKSNSIASMKKSNRRRTRMLSQAQRTTILELNTQGVSKREIARIAGNLARSSAQSSAIQLDGPAGTASHREGSQSSAIQLDGPAGTASHREGGALPATDPGAFRQVSGESRASP